ncbi:MAG: TetR/AcrR family transcriptional regulator [Thermocrispum agreste]|uniref:TetR/AcrR family transcriptional regulator n=1 Tax=Thermocrispum agreste TaxID=37925 RepID=A0ABD6FCC6_9PSEU
MPKQQGVRAAGSTATTESSQAPAELPHTAIGDDVPADSDPVPGRPSEESTAQPDGHAPEAGAQDQAPAEESTHERILRVAAEVFARKGYHGTGVAELGDAAGLKRGALYYHIGSKEDLLYNLSKRHVEEALARGKRVVESDLHPIDKLRALAREHIKTIAARRDEVIVVLREMHALTGKRAKQLAELRHQHQDLFAQVLQEGVDAGVFRSADSVAVMSVLGMLNWTYVWFDATKGPLTPEQVADKITDIALYGQLLPTQRRSGKRKPNSAEADQE